MVFLTKTWSPKQMRNLSLPTVRTLREVLRVFCCSSILPNFLGRKCCRPDVFCLRFPPPLPSPSPPPSPPLRFCSHIFFYSMFWFFVRTRVLGPWSVVWGLRPAGMQTPLTQEKQFSYTRSSLDDDHGHLANLL